MENAPALTPFPLDVLLGRVAHEWETRQRIFDLPTARFWKPSDAVDLSMEFLGRQAATPVGPAAGREGKRGASPGGEAPVFCVTEFPASR